MDSIDPDTCPLCGSDNASTHRDCEGATTKCPDCHFVLMGGDFGDDIPMLEFPTKSLKRLKDWFPDGVLDVDDVLDACAGHKVKKDDPILLRVTKFSDLKVTDFQAVAENAMH